MTHDTGPGREPDNHDRKKRQTLQRLAVGAAFVAPVVTSVSMDGMTISKVYAATAASSGMTSKDDKKKHDKERCREREEYILEERPAKKKATKKKAKKKVAKKKTTKKKATKKKQTDDCIEQPVSW